jgi:predicted ATPase
MTQKIHYLVGPNGTGKTRALDRLCDQHSGFFIPKDRPQRHSSQFDDNSTTSIIRNIREHRAQPELIAMSLLRENAKLRYTVFQILSRKLGRNFSVEVVERSTNFKITSGLNDELFETITIPRYELVGESSGLRELLIILTLINANLSTKYFIDEPELSLHPEAQRFLKNEMIRLTSEKNIEFWIATHSPIFFAPESIDELRQATFFSDPQNLNGSVPDFENLTPGQKAHLEKSLLRLDSEKWLLVHARGVIFCEGFRDKVIFKKVLRKCGIDISQSDFSIVETGGKDDFSTLHLLCQAINKPSYYIGDLDCLIESKLLDKYKSNVIITKELSGIATDIQDYISRNITSPLATLADELLRISNIDLKTRDQGQLFYSNIERIRKKTNNSKSLLLELILKNSDTFKAIINDDKFDPKIQLLTSSAAKAMDILYKVGFLIIPSGSLETLYASNPISPDDDKEKISLFDSEYEHLETENENATKNRYHRLIKFIESIIDNTFDAKKFIRFELIKLAAKIQTIILEDRPVDSSSLKNSSKFIELKIKDLLKIIDLKWDKDSFTVNMESESEFSPAFKITLASDKGITTDDIIKFI